MNNVRKRSTREVSYYQSPRLERARHINEMQSRTFKNQLEVMEQNIRKKLKVRQNVQLKTVFANVRVTFIA